MKTDFPNNYSCALLVHGTTAKKHLIGYC